VNSALEIVAGYLFPPLIPKHEECPFNLLQFVWWVLILCRSHFECADSGPLCTAIWYTQKSVARKSINTRTCADLYCCDGTDLDPCVHSRMCCAVGLALKRWEFVAPAQQSKKIHRLRRRHP
jgi:hypothetical protein